MVDNLLKRAKAFIGLEEEGLSGREGVKQLEFVATSRRDRKQNSESADYCISIYEPKVYEDSLGISQQLRVGNPAIINLKHLEPNEGTRLVDFVCGTAYALDGHMIKIAESIFLFTPKEILINDIEGRSSFVEESVEEEPVSDNKFFSRR
jgi:FtsZ-interacting cell division protein YlmF